MTVTPTESETSEQAPRWGMADVVVAFLVAQVASLVGFSVFAAVRGVPASELSTDTLAIGEVALLQIPLWLGLLGVPLLATRLRGNGPVTDLGWRSTLWDAPAGVAIGVACQFVLVPIVTLPVFLLSDTDRAALEAPARELTDKATGPGVLVLILVVVVAAPLAEEVFFRGLLQRTLARRLPIWPAMVVTSLAFGASHFQLLQFPALAAFGLVLSYLAHRTGRLGLNTWAHVGFNATTVAVLLLQR
ncbi:MAG: lysostaphin resistance A-like protein [Acidimicrobiales bacterium]